MSETFTRDDLARAWQEGVSEMAHRAGWKGPTPTDGNPYAAPVLPTEPPQGTVVVADDGVAWQRDEYGEWCWAGGETTRDWQHLITLGPLRVAVPLTDDERAMVVSALRDVSGMAGDALADRIEGTLP